MYKNILIPVFLGDDAKAETGVSIARALLEDGGKITLFHVVEEIPVYAEAYIPATIVTESFDAAVSGLDSMARKLGRDIGSEVVRGHASRTILDHAINNNVDCIIVASHRPGFEDYFLGSTAARVVRHATCAVHVIR